MGDRLRILLALLMFITGASPGLVAEPYGDGLLSELLSTGLSIGNQAVRLTPPKAEPTLPAAELAAAQKDLAGSRGWTQFTRDSIVAPIHMDLDYVKDAEGRRVGQRVHFAFVVHTDLGSLRNDDVMREMFTAEAEESESEGFRAEKIDPQLLMDQGLEVEAGSSYGWLETILLNKVSLSGVMRSERIDNDDFFAVAWKLDPRFTDRESGKTPYRNEWRKLQRDDVGKMIRGEPKPYAGTGGYLIASRLVDQQEASLIEVEVVLHEPAEWFSGSNLLRSKLPLIIQESVRKLRRGLK